MDTFWPTLAEGLEQAGAGNGNGGRASGGGVVQPSGDAIVFRSSSAMQILKIPDPPRAPEPVVSAGPAAAPQQEQPQASSSSALLVGVVCLAVGLGVGYFVFKGKPQPVQDQPTMLAQAPAEPAGQPGEITAPLDEPEGEGATEAAATETGEPTEGAAAADEKAAEGGDQAAPAAGDTSDVKGHHRAGKGKRRGKGRRHAKAAASGDPAAPAPAAKPAKAKPAAAKPAKAKKAGAGGDLLDSLIDDAIGKQAAPSKGKAAPVKAKKEEADPTKPDQLNMNQIRRSMNRIKGLVVSCYDKYQVEGRANTKLMINNNGSVKNVEVKGKFFGTDTGTCVIKAVKKARFPSFRGKPMTIRYPFILQ